MDDCIKSEETIAKTNKDKLNKKTTIKNINSSLLFLKHL